MTSYKILITGARSKTAESLTRFIRFETLHDLVLLSRNSGKLDDDSEITKYTVNLNDIKELKKICYSEKPDFIINTSSFNNAALAEKQKKKAWDANVVAVENLINVSRVLDCILIHLSCFHIFNGHNSPYTESGIPDPLNYLGKSKHAAENTCLARHYKSVIVRTGPVYGYSSYGMHGFAAEAVKEFNSGKKVKVSRDYHSSPSFTDDIARVILKIIDKKRIGIFNASGPEILSHKSINEKIANTFNLDGNQIEELPHEKVFPYPFIKKGGLVSLKAETDLGIKFTDFENGLLAIKYKMQKGKKRLKR